MKNEPSVPDGFRVWYEHRRLMKQVPTTALYHYEHVLDPRGGSTVAKLFELSDDPKEDEPVAVGVATCSTNDNYCKKVGRTIALGRAVRALG
jgi:hypothetical protein